MGFDNDDPSIFDRQIEFIQHARISFSMSGMLSAIPKTPLHARLAEEGRLDLSDPPEYGTNVIPLNMTREELRDGYVRVLTTLYESEAYWERTEALYLKTNFSIAPARARYWRKHPWQRIKTGAKFFAQAIGLFVRLMNGVPEASIRREYRKRLWRYLKVRQDPVVLGYVFHMAMHYHAHTLASQMVSKETAIMNSF